LGGIDRSEAVAVFRELTELHTEIAYATIVSIDKTSDTEGYSLKIKCVLDSHSRDSINEFLKKRNLQIREEKGYVIIYQ